MAWDDLYLTDRALTEALNSFNWSHASDIVTRLVTRMRAEPDNLPVGSANRMLRRLRRKRQFSSIELLAEQVIAEDRASGEVRRHYAQALIDENHLPRAEQELVTVLNEPTATLRDVTEANGLLGRVYKQRYVSAAAIGIQPDPTDLLRALDFYWKRYCADRQKNYWPGINVVALLMRAARDHIATPAYEQPDVLAGEILSSLAASEEEAELNAWQLATALEAHIALGELEKAELRALEYASSFDADAFEVFSTLRQLNEVWQLTTTQEKTAERLLPILDAALLRRQGGEILLTPQEAGRQLEENYGSDRFNTVQWYQDGLERCRSIARIVTLGGTAVGTGWLVQSQDFFPAQPQRTLLLTNAHVISEPQWRNALYPGDAVAEFQISKARLKVLGQVWSSTDLDATFVELEGNVPEAEPLTVYTRKLRMTTPASRVYIIGHPKGGELMFSLQDSLMAGSTDEYVHYRTPTKEGSSGSPVFESMAWRVVALHHAAVDSISANEGIPIVRIQAATAAQV